MKTQAVQVDERKEEERQISATGLSRPNYQRTVEQECLRKEHFFVNHYCSHLVGQCCCQQHDMMVRRGETIVERVHKVWVTLFQVDNPFLAHIYIICKMYAQ